MTEKELTSLVSRIIRIHSTDRKFEAQARKMAIKNGMGNMHLGDQQAFEAVKSALLRMSTRRGNA